jgi:hypothetical protein
MAGLHFKSLIQPFSGFFFAYIWWNFPNFRDPSLKLFFGGIKPLMEECLLEANSTENRCVF